MNVDGEAGFGAAEARLYTILAELISFPSDDLGDFVASGMVANTVGELASRLPWVPELPLIAPALLPPPGEVEAAYICLFDVPDPDADAALHGRLCPAAPGRDGGAAPHLPALRPDR